MRGVNQALEPRNDRVRDDICIGRFVCLKDMALSVGEAIKLICSARSMLINIGAGATQQQSAAASVR